MIRTSFFKKVACWGGVIFLTPFPNELKANIDLVSTPSTHYEVQPPKSILFSEKLLVGLKPYLGRNLIHDSPSQNLELISAGKPLVLKDSAGIVHKSRNIKIGWKKVPLKEPKYLSRQVVGPFASFESANTFSQTLKSQGISNLIAHPADWEVWIPRNTNLPSAIEAKSFAKKINYEIKPTLKIQSDEFLLSGQIQINAPDGLNWQGGIYSGLFMLKPDAYGTWTLIEEVSIEKYLHGVIPHEIGPSSPLSAKAAQAVLARTWAVANSSRFEVDGYHLCSDTQCQVYRDPQKADFEVSKAIKTTKNKILTWNGQPIHAVYHATNGGIMSSANEAWNMQPLAYLRPMLDGSKRWKKNFSTPFYSSNDVKRLLNRRDGAYGNNHHLFRWTRQLNSSDLRNYLKNFELDNEIPTQLKVIQRGPSGRVLALEVFGKQGKSLVILRRDSIRRTLKNLPSTLFIIKKIDQGVWEFKGGGFGHGAGMSQAGAIDLALRGWTTTKILQHYYPGTRYESFR